MAADPVVRNSVAVADPDAPQNVIRPNADGSINTASAVSGAVDAVAYSDPTGAADGDMISLLKGIYVQLAIIATNTTPP